MNLLIIKGRIVKDVQAQSTKTGKTFARFTVAVDRGGKDKGADFINCIAWDRTADLIAKYFGKGKEILLQGRITTGSYTDKDGKKVYTTDVVADRVEFCGSKGNSAPVTESTEIPF